MFDSGILPLTLNTEKVMGSFNQGFYERTLAKYKRTAADSVTRTGKFIMSRDNMFHGMVALLELFWAG